MINTALTGATNDIDGGNGSSPAGEKDRTVYQQP
jgi:hypothetical protein